jgi:alkanesulfonate monooxygenase SsuD/methylene tetrahydromethanopterin reductase-like flavin-dependent oxidoreductase (luciferase family)
MRIGIGLPAGIPGTDRTALLDWARRAENRGFATLGAIDRLVYRNWEPLIALAAAAAVTERIDLLSAILAVPIHGSPALLAKQAATLQELAAGRLRLGVGLGARRDDYRAGDAEPTGRGATLDAALAEMLRVWAGESRGLAGPIGPLPAVPPDLLVAGFAPASFERAARLAQGWIGAGPPVAIAAGAEAARRAWLEAGRDDEPWLAAVAYFGLGPTATVDAAAYLGDYYAIAGKPEHLLPGDAMANLRPEDMAAAALTDAESVRGACAAYAESGCQELIFLPVSNDPAQVDALADAAQSSLVSG